MIVSQMPNRPQFYLNIDIPSGGVCLYQCFKIVNTYLKKYNYKQLSRYNFFQIFSINEGITITK